MYEELKIRYPNAWPAFLPSAWHEKRFGPWVDLNDCDDAGNFIGYCPLHDNAKEHDASAEFNFSKGIMRCQADPSCHPGKRAMSLQNVVNRMQSDGGE